MQKTGGETVNKSPAAKPDRPDEFKIAGNVKESGQDPSPDDRERGETSSATNTGLSGTRGADSDGAGSRGMVDEKEGSDRRSSPADRAAD